MKKAALYSCALVALAGCTSMTPTREENASYAIYNIHTADTLSPSRIADAIKGGLRAPVTLITSAGNI